LFMVDKQFACSSTHCFSISGDVHDSKAFSFESVEFLQRGSQYHICINSVLLILSHNAEFPYLVYYLYCKLDTHQHIVSILNMLLFCH
jgi:hypothetical protein